MQTKFSRQIVQFFFVYLFVCLFYGSLELHGEWRISYKSIVCFECNDEAIYIVAKSVLDVIFSNHIGQGEKKITSAEKKCRQQMIIKKEYYLYFISITIYIFILYNFKPFRFYQEFLHSYKNLSVLNISQLFTAKKEYF